MPAHSQQMQSRRQRDLYAMDRSKGSIHVHLLSRDRERQRQQEVNMPSSFKIRTPSINQIWFARGSSITAFNASTSHPTLLISIRLRICGQTWLDEWKHFSALQWRSYKMLWLRSGRRLQKLIVASWHAHCLESLRQKEIIQNSELTSRTTFADACESCEG